MVSVRDYVSFYIVIQPRFTIFGSHNDLRGNMSSGHAWLGLDQLRIDMSFHLYTLSRLRANHFLLVLLNAAFLVKEATNTNFHRLWFDPSEDQANPRSTTLEASTAPTVPQICGLFIFEVEYFHIKIKVIRDQHSIHNSILLYNYKHQRKSKVQSSMYSRH